MGPARSSSATGYPPVTRAEEEKSAETAAAAPSAGGAKRIDADGQLIVDAMAAVFDEHRRRIGAIALDAQGKRIILDLLDEIFLDLLQSVLDEAPALEFMRRRRHASSRA